MTPARRAATALFAVLCVMGIAGAPARAADCADPGPPYERIVTLSPHLTENAFAAGIGDRLVGAVAWSRYPEAARALPRVGDAFRIDMERLIALKPDLVIGWSSGNPDAALDQIEALCLPLWRTETREPAGIADLIERLGTAGDAPKQAAAADGVRQALAGLSERYLGAAPVRYFYQVAPRPLFTINGDHLISQGLALCGGVNVFADAPGLAPQISREAVLAARPEVMLAPDSEPDPLAPWRNWSTLPAVRDGALHTLPAAAISQATPRFVEALGVACDLLDAHRRSNGHNKHRAGP